MMDLHKDFAHPFNDPNISMDELIAFSADHLARLTASNPEAGK